MNKNLDGVMVEVEGELLEQLRVLLSPRGNKKAFMNFLPRTKAITKKGKPLYTRRQLDYGLDRGVMYQGLLNHLVAFQQLISPENKKPAVLEQRA